MRPPETTPPLRPTRHTAFIWRGVRYVFVGAVAFALLAGVRQSIEVDATTPLRETVALGALAGSLVGALIWGIKSLQQPVYRWLGLVLLPVVGFLFLVYLAFVLATFVQGPGWGLLFALVPPEAWPVVGFMCMAGLAPIVIGALFLIHRRSNRDK